MKEMFSVEQVAQKLEVTTRTIRNYLKEGKLEGTKVGGQWRFSLANIYDFLGKREDVVLESEISQHFLVEPPREDHSLIVLTFKITDISKIDGIKEAIVEHYNTMYGGSSHQRIFHYQLLADQLIRITLSGPTQYVLNFSSWISRLIEWRNASR